MVEAALEYEAERKEGGGRRKEEGKRERGQSRFIHCSILFIYVIRIPRLIPLDIVSHVNLNLVLVEVTNRYAIAC